MSMTLVKPMSLPELQLVLDWAATEGWNPGIDDAAAFFAADPEGFLLARHEDEPAAAISVVRQDSQHAFLGLYICHPAFRSKGIGWTAWQTGMQSLEGYSVGLDGVLEQQANYQKSGFSFAYRNIRFSGASNALLKLGQQLNDPQLEDIQHRSIQPNDLSGVRSLDKEIHGMERRLFLDSWLQDTRTRHSLVSLRGNDIVGFGTIRQCQQGHKLGPVIAESTQQALSLMSALAELANAGEITLDVAEPNDAAVQLAKSIDLEQNFETARMYRGPAPNYKLSKLYGVSTFELG